MDITLRELLELKNNLGVYWREHPLGGMGRVEYGTQFQNEMLVEDSRAIAKIDAVIDSASRLKEMIGEVRNKISEANAAAGIPGKVSTMKANEALINFLTESYQHGKAVDNVRRQQLPNGSIETIRVRFVPHMSAADMKATVKKLRAENRALQRDIDEANAGTVTLTFSYEDVEDAVLS